ncbi:ketoacyl-ACP synthase III [Polaribacter litorisediminis]|uniref:3-oxoacyl-ACP synthase III family protein n=1 Tax=Polaribacter litorisediminis TaxID=1908341 RepID=UPI001CC06AFE|nr:ketoacyl-ACP synthase III [Polaribacter litorisediminis]UAM96589.1 ketoacyl-ACP synthase III [Polaribacter litorisediminis]
MPNISFENIGISGMAAAVPKNTIDNYAYTEFFPAEDVKDIVDKVGIKERRFAPTGMCSSDLCFAAAEQLINDLQIEKQEIDLLIFVSQTPDYRMPATAITLQHRLGLGKHVAAFDISLGCSAFVYGLSVVYGLMQSGGFRKALLLDGETRSRVYSPKDRKTAFLFGDGGVAAIIEQNKKFGKSYFSLNSDGALADLIKIDAGGYRNPSSAETLTEKVVDEYGNKRTDEQGYMNGADVFNFVLKEIPKNFKSVLAFSGNTNESIDFNIFHQANKYMNSYLAKKLKLDSTKVPSCIAQFGNTSSVSIPLTIVSQLQNELKGPKKLMLCGFGVGMSWATAQIQLEDCVISNVVEL